MSDDGRFTAAQAARLSGCPASRLEAWRRLGLVTPEAEGHAASVAERHDASVAERHDASVAARRDATYGFRDLVALRMVTELLDEGVPMARIRRAVRALLAAGDDIASLSLVSNGDTVLACRDDGQVLDALGHGQLALFVSVERLAQDVDADVRVFAAERATFVDAISAPG